MKIRKIASLALALAMCLILCACQIQTPYGTLNMTLDESKKSDQTKVIDENGKETIIPTGSIVSYIDALLDEVAIPNGGTTADLKSFVWSTLGVVGIDRSKLDDGTSMEDLISAALAESDLDLSDTESVEQAIKDALEEQGIDASDISLDIDSIIKEANGDAQEDGK